MAKDFMSSVGDAISSAAADASAKVKSAVKDVTSNLFQSAPTAIPTGYKPDSLRGSNDAIAFNPTANAAPTIQEDSYQISFLPNILDNYDTYTYHWKLFITSTESAASGKVLSPDSQTIIAESGVTDITIDKVNLHGIAVPSVETGTGTQTLVKFEIVEPAGAGLLDKMFYEAASLGVGNWLVMPCFLQLDFRSRDPVTAASSEAGATGELAGKRWVWPVKVTNVKANVTVVGTQYEFDGILYDELAQSNSYFSILHNIALRELTNFGKAMEDLEEKLNADQYEKLIDNYSIPDTYKIIVDPALKGLDISLKDANKHTSRHSDYFDFDLKAANYNTGTSIDKIIDSLLGSTDYFQTKLQSSETRISEPKPANQADSMRKFWRIITETKPVVFDPLRQDNAVEITIYVVEYDIGLQDVIPAQSGQTPSTLPAAKKRMSTYMSKKIMKKRYNYIFTGLNDQVISFDLNMNFSYAASLSRFGGIFYDTAIRDRGVVQNPTIESEKEAAEKVRKTIQYVNNAPPGTDVLVEIEATKSSISNAIISNESKEKYTKLLDKARSIDRKDYTKELKAAAAGVRDADGNLKQAASLAKSNAGLKFVSDVNVNSAAAKAAKDAAENNRRGKLRPVPYREGMQEINLAMGIDPTSDAARSRTSSIFSTALYSTLDASLQLIKITIKGDPFWLFPNELPMNQTVLPYKSNMGEAQAIKLIKEGMDRNKFVNFFGTDNFIIIRFRTPKLYSEEHGSIEPFTEVETFSGVYKVITVISKFEMGKFTQELTCILDPMINLRDFPQFLRDVETANQNPSNTIESPDIEIPEEAIKTQRIMGAADQIKGQVATIRDKATGAVVTAQNAAIGKAKDAVMSNIPVMPNLTADDLLSRIPKPPFFG